MSTKTSNPWKYVASGLVIAVGFALILRIGLQLAASFKADKPQSMAEAREVLKFGAKLERENWEKDWIASGQPPPPGGFDAAWKAARGGWDEASSMSGAGENPATPTSSAP